MWNLFFFCSRGEIRFPIQSNEFKCHILCVSSRTNIAINANEVWIVMTISSPWTPSLTFLSSTFNFFVSYKNSRNRFMFFSSKILLFTRRFAKVPEGRRQKDNEVRQRWRHHHHNYLIVNATLITKVSSSTACAQSQSESNELFFFIQPAFVAQSHRCLLLLRFAHIYKQIFLWCARQLTHIFFVTFQLLTYVSQECCLWFFNPI